MVTEGGSIAVPVEQAPAERTVENHLRRIRKRLGGRNTVHAILIASQTGEIEY